MQSSGFQSLGVKEVLGPKPQGSFDTLGFRAPNPKPQSFRVEGL